MRTRNIVLLAATLAVGCSQSSPVTPDSAIATAPTAVVIPEPGDNGGRPLTATLTTEAEGPACTNDEPPAGRGTATISVNVGLRQVCWVIDIENVSTAFTGAHIHKAPAGFSGPIVVPVDTPAATGHSEGCTTTEDRELLKDIVQNPEAYYVNVHNQDCRGGVARGQLSK